MKALVMVLAGAVMLLNLLQILYWGKPEEDARGCIALFFFGLLSFIIAGIAL